MFCWTKGVEAGSVLVLGACLAFAQTSATPPAFELASIKPSDPTSTMAIRRSGHRIATVNTSLLFLITWAYDVRSDRILDQPKWLDSVHYDILASSPEDQGPTKPRLPGQPSELQQMTQALLAERFKLAVHRETRELPIYALVAAKGGPKFHLAEAPASMGENPFAMPGRGHLTGTQVSAEMLANVLSGVLNRTVQDQTGLKGVFDFKLQWEPDLASGGPERAAADLRAGSSLFSAIQEQLGLKLEGRKGTVDVLVIDHMESVPTEN